jgi:hypothetical protein
MAFPKQRRMASAVRREKKMENGHLTREKKKQKERIFS